MKLNIKIDGISKRKVDGFITKQPKAFSKAVKIGLMRIGLDIRSAAGRKAPYLSGNLRRSLTSKTDSAAIYEHSTKGKTQQVAVGSNLVYARIQEFGGKTGRGGAVNIVARKFLRPAFKTMKDGEGSRILSEEVQSAINKF